MIYSLIVVFWVQTPLYVDGRGNKTGNNTVESTVEIPMATAEDCSRVMAAMKSVKGVRVSCAAYDDNSMGGGLIPLFDH